MWRRPLSYLIVIPATFGVGYISTVLLSTPAALGVPGELIRFLVGPVGTLSMLAFLFWARTDKNGNFQLWPW
jgi:hypothetical protein